MMHMQNQLAFDLWYIFLGVFCICIAEADKIVDSDNPVRISTNPGNAKHMILTTIPGLLRLPDLL